MLRLIATKTSTVLIAPFLALLLQSCTYAGEPLPAVRSTEVAPTDLFSVPDTELSNPFVFVIYGDMRFTDPSETVSAAPGPRRALVAKVALEHPDALFLTGDVPWHGGSADDYRVFRNETLVWEEERLRVYPVLGNHEFSQCEPPECLENWWQAFPRFRDRRWYAVALGTKIRAFALDSDASLQPGSEQRQWFERELEALPGDVRFVLINLHHPPVADDGLFIVRSNERALATYLASVARRAPARFIVCSGHVHNYERFERDGILYLVSGGGGAKPLVVHRGSDDLYQSPAFPNFHYLRFELRGERLTAEMVRLEDFDAPMPHVWAVKDRFEVTAKSR